ncbi:MAG: hypothetical protein DMD44_06790 [Gemmatimonadetes bacterium]|nr:MAG: hypothetical protein DMD44_06790 [Gemmatimonadota bacterium]
MHFVHFLNESAIAPTLTHGACDLPPPAAGTVQFAKQPVRGGAGGNPWIYPQFLDAAGAPFGQEFLIGRCSQLG